jgi:hypothetical protein
MDPSEKAKNQTVYAAEVLRRLDELGAIKLDVLVAKSKEIQSIAGIAREDEPDICYQFYIRVGPPGPRAEFDLVSVASQLKDLGFDISRAKTQLKG